MDSGGERVTRQLRALLATVVYPGSGWLVPPSFLFECRPHKAYCVHLQAGSHPTLNPDTREIKKQESSLLFLFPELSLTLPTPTAHMSLGGPWDAVTPIPPPPMPPPHAGIHVAGWAIKPQWSWSVHPVRDAPSSSARHCILYSCPVPFSCVLEYFLSDQAICLILLLKEWTLLCSGEGEKFRACWRHTWLPSLSPCAAPGRCHFGTCKGIALESQCLADVHSH